MARTLLNFGAHPDSEYGFKAGVENMDCRLPPEERECPNTEPQKIGQVMHGIGHDGIDCE
eukprot:1727580-Amphidinium_carterae.2